MESASVSWLSHDTSEAHFGVFDGTGGEEVAKFVSRHFTATLFASPSYPDGQFKRALKETFLFVDHILQTPEGQKDLIRLRHNLPDDYRIEYTDAGSLAGCTAVVALIKNGQLFVANAGGSRCVLARSGQAVPMSVDHRPYNSEERARIERAGASVCDGRVESLNFSRGIGFLHCKHSDLPPQEQPITPYPEVKVEQLSESDDFLVVACDGIWDMVSNQECADFVYQRLEQGMPLSQIVEELFDRCLAPDIATYGGFGCDDMTCIIVLFKDIGATVASNVSRPSNQSGTSSSTASTAAFSNFPH